MAEIVQAPQLRHTPEGMELTEMMVQFAGLRPDDPPANLRVVGWGNMAKEVHQNYRQGDRVLLEGRLSMTTIERRPEGFKEKRAELSLQRIHRLDAGLNTALSGMETTAPSPEQYYREPDPTPVPQRQVSSPREIPNYDPPVPSATPARSSTNARNQEDYTSYPAASENNEDEIPF
jgi:single-stranded DNA-binding protein